MATDLACDPPNTSSRRNTTPDRAQLAAVQIRSDESIVFCSDSLSTGFGGQPPWPNGAGNFAAQVNAILGAGNEITVTPTGAAGTGIVYLGANLASIVFASDPTMVMLLVGINDAVLDPPVDNFLQQYVMVLARIKAWKPTVKIVCIGLGPRSTETWAIDGATGLPTWNPAQPSLYTYDAYIAQAAASMGCVFVDWRRWLLAWEVINNPGQAALGFATIDGTHLTNAGQLQLAAAVLQSKYVTVAP